MFHLSRPHWYNSNVNRQLLADSSLVLCTLVWGATFVLVKDSVAQVTPLLFIAARFALGALTLALLTLAMGRFTRLTMRELKWGTFLGILLFAGYAFQTAGLQYTTASNGGFITGLSVAIVPLLALPILRHRPHPFAIFGVVLATVGLALLSLQLRPRHHYQSRRCARLLLCGRLRLPHHLHSPQLPRLRPFPPRHRAGRRRRPPELPLRPRLRAPRLASRPLNLGERRLPGHHRLGRAARPAGQRPALLPPPCTPP